MRKIRKRTARTVLTEMCYSVGRETQNPEALLITLASQVPQHGDTLMTIAEQLKLKGRQEGIQLGEAKGRQEAQREMARNMLAIGIDHTTIMQVTGLTAAELEQVRH